MLATATKPIITVNDKQDKNIVLLNTDSLYQRKQISDLITRVILLEKKVDSLNKSSKEVSPLDFYLEANKLRIIKKP